MEEMEKLLDSREAAAFLGVSTKTLQRLARSGDVQAIKIGKPWRFRKEDLIVAAEPKQNSVSNFDKFSRGVEARAVGKNMKLQRPALMSEIEPFVDADRATEFRWVTRRRSWNWRAPTRSLTNRVWQAEAMALSPKRTGAGDDRQC